MIKTCKKIITLVAVFTCMLLLVACGNDNKTKEDSAVKNTEEALKDGEYTASVELKGGSGKATVESPAKVTVKDGKIYATIVWSSKNYDYMIVNDEKYLNEAEADNNSTFTIPVEAFDKEISVIGDTVAMGNPHEIEYTLIFKLEE